MITEKLPPSLFKQVEVLNIDLFKYLLSSPDKFEDKIKATLCQMVGDGYMSFFFAIWPVLDKEEIKTLVRLLNIQHPSFVSSSNIYNLYNTDINTRNIIKAYTVNTLYFLSECNLEESETKNSQLSYYISNSKDFLNIDEPNVELLIQQFQLLCVRFKQIEYKSANKALFDAVYQNNLYELNMDNINLMLATQYPVENDEDIKHKNYSIIMRQPDSYLAQYVLQNINEYIKLLLLNCDEMINDDEDHVIQILNNQDINIGHQHVYINYLRTVINNPENIENKKLWPKLISAHNIACTEENILLYFQNVEVVDDGLIEFINNSKNVLNFESIWNDDNHDLRLKFFNKIIINQNIIMQKYGEILGSLGFIQFEPDFDSLNKDRFRILVAKEAICLQLEDFETESIILLKSIRENCDSDDVLYFIEKNLKNYLTLMAQNKKLFDLKEVLNLIEQLKNDSKAIELLKCTEEQISVIDNTFTPAVMAYVLKHNFNTNDLPDLLQEYDEYEDVIQTVILELAIKHVDLIKITQESDITENLLKALLLSRQLTQAKKIDLFIQALPYKFINNHLRLNVLMGMRLSKYTIIWSNGIPNIRACPEYQRLLTTLKEYDLVRDFCIDDNDRDYFVITKRSAKK